MIKLSEKLAASLFSFEIFDKTSSMIQSLSLEDEEKKKRDENADFSVERIEKLRTHCDRTTPASLRRIPASFADAEAVSRRSSWAPGSGTWPVAPCWCSPCARWPCIRDSERPGGCGRAAPGRTRRTAWSCDTCTRATCVRPRTRGSSCETAISHVYHGLAKLDARPRDCVVIIHRYTVNWVLLEYMVMEYELNVMCKHLFKELKNRSKVMLK